MASATGTHDSDNYAPILVEREVHAPPVRERLLALEEGHLPTEIDARTLAMRGYCDFGRRVAGPFTPRSIPSPGR